MSKRKAIKLMDELAHKCIQLTEPIHVIAIVTGGRVVGKNIVRYLRSKGKQVDYFEVQINVTKGKASIWKTDFKKKNYTGTALLAEDVVWQGKSLKAAKRMLRNMSRKKFYTAVLLDFNKLADFSIFS